MDLTSSKGYFITTALCIQIMVMNSIAVILRYVTNTDTILREEANYHQKKSGISERFDLIKNGIYVTRVKNSFEAN